MPSQSWGPRVSVIMPCYRQARYLPAAIESVLGQSYPHIEIIVVNDGSDDDTEAVAARYADRVRYIGKENGGPNSARNAGIGVATGTYLHFFDADDLLHPQTIEWLVEAMEDCEDRLCVCGYRNFEQEPADETGQGWIPEVRAILPDYLHDNPAPIHAYLCPTSAVRLIGGFDERLRYCEEWDLWIRLGIAGVNIRVVSSIGAYYRQYDGSASKNTARMLTARTEVLLRAHRSIVQRPELVDIAGMDLVAVETRVLRRLLAQRHRSSLVRELTDALAELDGLGYRRSESKVRRMLRMAIGNGVEQLSIQYSRLFRPQRFAADCDGFK